MNTRYLIANTTREERERIVAEALSCDVGCEDDCSQGDFAMYQPYIDGIMELRECTRAFRAGYVKADMIREERSSCME